MQTYAIQKRFDSPSGKPAYSYGPTGEEFTSKAAAYRRRNQLLGRQAKKPYRFRVQRTNTVREE